MRGLHPSDAQRTSLQVLQDASARACGHAQDLVLAADDALTATGAARDRRQNGSTPCCRRSS